MLYRALVYNRGQHLVSSHSYRAYVSWVPCTAAYSLGKTDTRSKQHPQTIRLPLAITGFISHNVIAMYSPLYRKSLKTRQIWFKRPYTAGTPCPTGLYCYTAIHSYTARAYTASLYRIQPIHYTALYAHPLSMRLTDMLTEHVEPCVEL